MSIASTRRELITAGAVLGATGLLGARTALAADGPPEITTARLLRDTTCGAPIAIAEDLIHAEGFSEVKYSEFQPGLSDIQHIVDGFTDLGACFAPDVVKDVASGVPIVAVAGFHVGCQELFAHAPIASIKELKGKRVALTQLDYGTHLTLSVVAASVGLDPARDIEWVIPTSSLPDAPGPRQLFEAGEVDAYLALPPNAQELRARGLGRVILRTSTDRPWSQYFCCMLVARRNFIQENPAATKRLLRAILKSTDFCAADPAGAAQRLAERAPERSYEMARAIMAEVPYDDWRDYDPEDTLRFFALRLREVGMIKSDPNALIAAGTDWRFLNEIKRELKA